VLTQQLRATFAILAERHRPLNRPGLVRLFPLSHRQGSPAPDTHL